jgi:hypothetical protein
MIPHWLRRLWRELFEDKGGPDRVSDKWRLAYRQREGCDGVDAVCWRVPEAGVANAPKGRRT